MRLIGNKTRLLGDIEKVLRQHGVLGGTLLDVFAGTSNVGRYFKRAGFRVFSNDMLSMCYTQAVAGIEVSGTPKFEGLRRHVTDVMDKPEFSRSLLEKVLGWELGGSPGLIPYLEALHFLNEYVPEREGLIFRSFCPGGPAERGYFRDENGRKIDGVLHFLRESLEKKILTRGEFHLLLASLIDAADKVANISGTYGAYLKSWQPNSEKPIELKPLEIIESDLEHRAFRLDANDAVRQIEADVAYVDPPYNHRQYAANYHVMEILAEYHRIENLEEYEASLYGKTGLRPYDDLKSSFCVPRNSRSGKRDVYDAMRDLVLSANAEHIIISYNEEGLLTKEEIGEILAEFSGTSKYDFARNFHSVLYRRFRSDSDHRAGDGKAARQYKVIEGKERNKLSEWLFYARRSSPASRRESLLAARGIDDPRGVPAEDVVRAPGADSTVSKN